MATTFNKSFLLAALLFGSSAASASIIPTLGIDFRDAAWSAANGMSSYTHNGVTATARNIGVSNTGVLYQDSYDGLGITGTISNDCGDVTSYEIDEMDTCELLRITLTDQIISEVWITDLFPESDAEAEEVGRLRFNTMDDTSTWNKITFYGADSTGYNGEQVVDLGGEYLVYQIDFFIPTASRDASDFSVAGFTVVPEPMPLILMGLTVLGFGALRRSR